MTARPDQQDSQKGLFPTSAVRGHPTLMKAGPRRCEEGQPLVGCPSVSLWSSGDTGFLIYLIA